LDLTPRPTNVKYTPEWGFSRGGFLLPAPQKEKKPKQSRRVGPKLEKQGFETRETGVNSPQTQNCFQKLTPTFPQKEVFFGFFLLYWGALKPGEPVSPDSDPP